LLVIARGCDYQFKVFEPTELPTELPHLFCGDRLTALLQLKSFPALLRSVARQFGAWPAFARPELLPPLARALSKTPDTAHLGLTLTALQARRLATHDAPLLVHLTQLSLLCFRDPQEVASFFATATALLDKMQVAELLAYLALALRSPALAELPDMPVVRYAIEEGLVTVYRSLHAAACVGGSLPLASGTQASALPAHMAKFLATATHEQRAVLQQEVHPGNKRAGADRLRRGQILRVSAAAGAGKTTTLEAYTALRPHLRFLFLAFNKITVERAQLRFPPNVTCKTCHKLCMERKDDRLVDFTLRMLREVCRPMGPWMLEAHARTLLHLAPPFLALAREGWQVGLQSCTVSGCFPNGASPCAPRSSAVLQGEQRPKRSSGIHVLLQDPRVGASGLAKIGGGGGQALPLGKCHRLDGGISICRRRSHCQPRLDHRRGKPAAAHVLPRPRCTRQHHAADVCGVERRWAFF
jgi:hypothetical protein